ncbi:MurR/RpiR family transcriptional regulator [Corynebacterium sp. MSK122]|uniref:MurR/RpiR family transcriptional regulator n=1 Tax=Corynebacterium sp. MSK122 TaxID=3050206 RepID=UPI003AF1E0E4
MTYSITEQINAKFPSLSQAEKDAARCLLNSYPWVGLKTVQHFASQANVSSATIVRFVQTLGFKGFKQFQNALMNETSERDASPLTQAGDEFRNSSSALLEQTLNQTATAYLRGIEATFKYAKEDDLERIVALFSDQQHRIICHGGTFSWILAQHLVAQLSLFRGNQIASPLSDLPLIELINQTSADDVWVFFDFRRYSPRSEQIARLAKENGAIIVIITDRWISPVAAYSDVSLVARVEAFGPSDTLVPAFALVEAICECVSRRIGKAGIQYLESFEALRKELC